MKKLSIKMGIEKWSVLTATALSTGFTSPALAQTDLFDEIIVFAQKREQSLQDVGIAVTAFTGDQLRALGVQRSVDLAAFTPGVHISGNLAGQNTQFTIRGVTQNDFNDIVEAPNAVYLDEGYIAIAQGQTFALFDVERVEVLKGPQGTLFGRNATGGLVHYISNKPSLDEVEGYVNLEYSLFDAPDTPGQFNVQAALGAPITEEFAVRGAIFYNNRQPLLKNLYPLGAVGGAPGPDAGADLYDDDTLAGRFTALWEPSEDLSFTLSFNGGRTRQATGPYQQKPTINVFDADGELVNTIDLPADESRASILLNPDGTDSGMDFGFDLGNTGVFGEPFGRPVAGGDLFGYIDPDGDDFLTSSDFAFEDSGSVDTWGVNLNAQWDDTENIVLTSISDYKDFEKLLFIDVDSGPGNQSANYAAVDASTFSQELRLNGTFDRGNWVVGAYYLNIDTVSDNGLKFPVGSVVPDAPFEVGSDADLQTNSYSAFAQFEYEFTEEFKIILGARIIQEEKDYVFAQNLYFTEDSRQIHQGTPVQIGPVFTEDGPADFVDSLSQTLWAGKIQLEYTPNEDVLWYLGVNRGVKAGSFNAQLSGGLDIPLPPEDFIPYGEEVLWSYEGGVKWTFADGRARLNATAFYYDYKDYQSFLFTGVSGVVINADAENYGAELELQVQPAEGLDLGAGIAWFDATVKDVPLRVGGPESRDVDPTYAPEVQFNGFARYGWQLGGGEAFVLTNVQYSSEYFYNLRNFDSDKFDSYFVWNFGVGWIQDEGNWELRFDMRNLTDERVGTQGFNIAGLCGCNEVAYEPPRSFALSARYNF